jgi:acyl-[acyl-carrier-protein] desaturase
MIAVSKQVSTFAMPGTGIPSFTRHAVRIAKEGIYGLGQYLSDVLTPVLALWDVEHVKGLSKEAENARIDLVNVRAKLAESVDRMANKTSLLKRPVGVAR